MLFIINEICLFNPHVGSVEPHGSAGEPLILSNPACMLLSYFIEHQGEVLSRDVLIEHVWVRRGYASSGSNLNNTVSQLRRLLASCNVLDVIVTIPKVGFSFSAEITVIEPESSVEYIENVDHLVINEIDGHGIDQTDQPITSCEEDVLNILKESESKVDVQHPTLVNKKKYTPLYFFVFLFFCIVLFSIFKKLSFDEIPLYNLMESESNVGQCSIYWSDELKKEDIDFLMEKYSGAINDKCDIKGDIYFVSRKGKGHAMDDFISICLLDFNYCYSISSVGWRYYED